MDNMRKKVAVLGSTGSVGKQAIDALSSANVEYTLLTGGKNIKVLAEQARATGAFVCAVPDENDAKELSLLLSGEKTKVVGGENAICEEIAKCGADTVVHSISGMAGIPSALAAAQTGCRIAIANKEAIIALGDKIYEKLEKSGGELIPVDSEHSAIFQCLMTSGAQSPKGPVKPEIIKRILLTASGGPFFGKSRKELEGVTAKEALAHPTWKMGKKITIDCATLMNKGFEVIEAVRLFGVDIDKVEVLVHRQSIIHSMVEYIDTTVMAQLGTPDMRHCVRYALSYPDRMTVGEAGLDFAALGQLTFAKPDCEAFPSLDIARKAYKMGGEAPAALIAADEVAVEAFMREEIGFLHMPYVVEKVLDSFRPSSEYTIESVLEADKEARVLAREVISTLK